MFRLFCFFILVACQCLVSFRALAANHELIHVGSHQLFISPEAKKVYADSYSLRSTVNHLVRNGKCNSKRSSTEDTEVSDYYLACVVENSPYHIFIFSKDNPGQLISAQGEVEGPFYQIELLDENLFAQIQERTFAQYRIAGQRRTNSPRATSIQNTYRRWIRYKMVATRDILDTEAFNARIARRQAEWDALLLQLDTDASDE